MLIVQRDLTTGPTVPRLFLLHVTGNIRVGRLVTPDLRALAMQRDLSTEPTVPRLFLPHVTGNVRVGRLVRPEPRVLAMQRDRFECDCSPTVPSVPTGSTGNVRVGRLVTPGLSEFREC